MDPKNAYGLDLNHPKTINPLVIVPTSFHFGYYIGYEHAYNTITGALMSLAAPIIDMFFIPSVKENIACSLLFWNKSEQAFEMCYRTHLRKKDDDDDD